MADFTKYPFRVFDRYRSHLQDVQDVFERICIILRPPSFQILVHIFEIVDLQIFEMYIFKYFHQTCNSLGYTILHVHNFEGNFENGVMPDNHWCKTN